MENDSAPNFFGKIPKDRIPIGHTAYSWGTTKKEKEPIFKKEEEQSKTLLGSFQHFFQNFK